MDDWIDSAVDEFCSAAGLDAVAFGDAAVLQMEFEKRGTLYIEKGRGELLLMLVRPINPYRRSVAMRKALQACDGRSSGPLVIQAAIRGEQDLVFIARISAELVTRQILEQTLEQLTQLHDNADS